MSLTFGKIYKDLFVKKLAEEKALLFLVIDPPSQKPSDAGKLAFFAEKAGVSAVVVGGSLGAQGELLTNTILSIKEKSSLPVILFPGNIATISEYADASYYLSMLNSLDPYYISGAQIAASLTVKRMNLEVIPTSYIVMEPGRAVGWVGRAKLIPRELDYLAAATALGGQFMGANACILESGSGASSPVPPKVISTTKKMIDVPLVIAGGVCKPKFAFDSIKAGADILHVGSALEYRRNSLTEIKNKLTKFYKEMKKAAKTKR